jgi:hypothetical protein
MISKRFNFIVMQACVIVISLTLFATLTNFVSASGGSIANLYVYPNDGETYESVDQIVYQLTAVNTNTTVSVSVDGGPPILMNYQGEINEAVKGDAVARDWYVWQVTIPSINDPGKHTLQFFSHYYVWQETDQYWAEFNASSDVKSFNIVSSTAAPSQCPSSVSVILTYVFAATVLSMLAALLALAKFKTRKPVAREIKQAIHAKNARNRLKSWL